MNVPQQEPQPQQQRRALFDHAPTLDHHAEPCPRFVMGSVQTVTEPSLARDDDEWRQRQAELDAQAIMQAMAQARQRAEQLAHTGR